jgi:hypothetical protein
VAVCTVQHMLFPNWRREMLVTCTHRNMNRASVNP